MGPFKPIFAIVWGRFDRKWGRFGLGPFFYWGRFDLQPGNFLATTAEFMLYFEYNLYVM